MADALVPGELESTQAELNIATVCPEEAPFATNYLDTALGTLSKLSQTWPMAEAWHDALRASDRSAETSGWGALKATAVAEKTADEAVSLTCLFRCDTS